MPIFVILIIFSISFYIYLKVKYVRSKLPMERQWISAKSSIALGAFVLLFGINQAFVYETKLSITVGILFAAIGLGSVWAGFRAYKYYLPLAAEEIQQQK